jgi:phosphodiesterase/alkaline phosphatase D-like protein
MTTGSNGAVFDTIRELDPLFFLAAGDFFYEDIAVADPEEFRTAFDRNLTAPAQAALYRRTSVAYVWDDHDYDSNNADATAVSRQTAYQVYDEVVPHYALRDGAEPPIYQAFTVGRVRFIVTDARSARSPADQPEEQKDWFKRQLLAANGVYPVIVWVNSVPWIAASSAGADNWGGYATERRELADFIAANQIDGLVMVSGDAHMLAIDDGSNSDYSTSGGGGFPVMHAAALDRHGSTKGGPYSEGSYPGGGQFGLVTVNDDGGAAVEVVLSGRDWRGDEIVTYRFTVPATPIPAGAA